MIVVAIVAVLVGIPTVALAPMVYRGETVARARVLLRRYRYDVKAPPGGPLRWPWPAAPEVADATEEENHGQSN